MKPRTRGEAEAEITQAVIKFEKEYLGRGPVDARTFFVHDMILIRLRGLLTAGDRKLAETREGQSLLKETRRQLFESSITVFEEMIAQIIGCKLISLHTDISSKTGERVVCRADHRYGCGHALPVNNPTPEDKAKRTLCMSRRVAK